MKKSSKKIIKWTVGIVISVATIFGVVQVAKTSGNVFTPQLKKKLTMEEMGLREPTATELEAPVLAGLTNHTAKMKIAIGEKYDILHYSLYRPGDPEDHGTGTAVDYMVYDDKEKGDEIVEFLTQHMDDLDIKYIIWQQKFYMPVRNIYGPANTWNPMPDRGSITANHYDHVHVSFKK